MVEKQLLIEGDTYPLPDQPGVDFLEEILAEAMEEGKVIEISVGEDEAALTKLLINGKALSYAGVKETPKREPLARRG